MTAAPPPSEKRIAGRRRISLITRGTAVVAAGVTSMFAGLAATTPKTTKTASTASKTTDQTATTTTTTASSDSSDSLGATTVNSAGSNTHAIATSGAS
jgi:hypothetical protein